VAETSVEARQLVLPVFVREDATDPVPITSMPGVVQHTRDSLRKAVAEAAALGLGGVMLFGIPQITVLPLFILFLGIGNNSKIAFGVSHTIFPIVFTCIAGCRAVDRQLLRAAQSMGAPRVQLFWKLVVPSILPWIVTGLRLGMAANLLGILLAELFVSQKGVGFFVRQFTASFKSAEMFGLVTTLALFAIVLNELLRYSERRLSAWRV